VFSFTNFKTASAELRFNSVDEKIEKQQVCGFFVFTKMFNLKEYFIEIVLIN
jgi:hypothetical protein